MLRLSSLLFCLITLSFFIQRTKHTYTQNICQEGIYGRHLSSTGITNEIINEKLSCRCSDLLPGVNYVPS